MRKTKIITSIILALVVAAAQVGAVLAAPDTQDPVLITGIIQSIEVNPGDTPETTTVSITLLIDAETNETQTITVSLQTAIDLNLVTENADTGEITVNMDLYGTDFSIDPSVIIEELDDDTPQHPVASMIAAFFGVDYETIAGYHEEGVGFGVIAQSCFMSYQIAGDASLCGDIILAKQSGDFSTITLPDGSTADNWGQFKKAAGKQKGFFTTLGGIMSGKANNGNNDDDTGDASVTSGKGQGKGNNDNSGKGEGEGNGKGKSKGKGKGHNK